ncbi:MAG TPA: tetratricopeptide repeat protein, partial [Bacteroidia bacterium]|nr:tetratricopeptide repeat protein [Bacteroidia bacterium]
NEKLDNKYSIQINLANIGYVYCKIKNFDSALKYQLKALDMSEEIKSRNSMAVNLGNVGETYFMMATDNAPENKKEKLQHLAKSIDYLERAIIICKETGFSGPQIEFSQFLSDAYHLAGNHEKAFKIFKEYSTLKDSVFSEENNIRLAQLEAQHELDLKDKDIVIQDKQLEIAGLAAANKRKERAIYISGIVLLVLFAGILITKALRRIRTQKNALTEIARIQSHDVRGPVSKILGLTQLFNYEDTTDPVNKEVIKYISTTAVEIDEIINTVVNKTHASK